GRAIAAASGLAGIRYHCCGVSQSLTITGSPAAVAHRYWPEPRLAIDTTSSWLLHCQSWSGGAGTACVLLAAANPVLPAAPCVSTSPPSSPLRRRPSGASCQSCDGAPAWAALIVTPSLPAVSTLGEPSELATVLCT